MFNQLPNRNEHLTISYFDNKTRLNLDSNLVNRTIRFMKRRNNFEIEQEYRFVFDTIELQQLQQNLEDLLILNVRTKDYIDKIISFGHENSKLATYYESRGIAFERFGD